MSLRLTGRTKKLFLAAFLSLPVLAISALLYWIAAGLARPSPMAGAERVGFGAGDTGGANAIGELLRQDRTRQPLTTERRSDSDPGVENPSVENPAGSVTGSRFLTIPVAGGAGSAADATRDLVVWLPPAYDDARQYPVLYVFDAQFAFAQRESAEPAAAAQSSWGIDEVSDRLIELGLIEPLVIVGVPHAGTARAEEYLPVAAFPGVLPAADEFAAWFLATVPQAIASEVSVSDDPADLAIAGAGFGAVIATVITTTEPQRFGGLHIESMPELVAAGDAWRTRLEQVTVWPNRVVIGMGGSEAGVAELDRAYVEWSNAVAEMLTKAGLGPDRLLLNTDPTGQHQGASWKLRLPDALQFLFPPNP